MRRRKWITDAPSETVRRGILVALANKYIPPSLTDYYPLCCGSSLTDLEVLVRSQLIPCYKLDRGKWEEISEARPSKIENWFYRRGYSDTVKTIIEEMVAEKLLEDKSRGRKHYYQLTKKGAEAIGDHYLAETFDHPKNSIEVRKDIAQGKAPCCGMPGSIQTALQPLFVEVNDVQAAAILVFGAKDGKVGDLLQLLEPHTRGSGR